MNGEKLFDAISGIDEELVAQAEKTDLKAARPRRRWIFAAAAVLAAAVAIAAMFQRGEELGIGKNTVAGAADEGKIRLELETEAVTRQAIQAAVSAERPNYPQTPASRSAQAAAFVLQDVTYPVMPQRVIRGPGNYTWTSEDQNRDMAWMNAMRVRWMTETALKELGQFDRSVTAKLLDDTEEKNPICSPITLYNVLAMVAETASGSTRAQIMQLLSCSSMEELRNNAFDTWNSVYLDDGFSKGLLSSSIWLRDNAQYNEETLKVLADRYKVSSFFGPMGSAEYSKALAEWISDQTHGLIDTGSIEMNDDTAAEILSTLYYKANWQDQFSESATKDGVFYSPFGDITAAFMHKNSLMEYYYANDFSAVTLDTESRAKMWFVLPDEGVSPKDILQSDAIFDLVLKTGSWRNAAYPEVDLYLPRFDVSCSTDLRSSLKALGVTDAFDPDAADFSLLSKDFEYLYISRAQQDLRVKVNEEGVEAAAVIDFGYVGSAEPQDKVELRFDHPFLFFLTNQEGLLLLAGIVNEP